MEKYVITIKKIEDTDISWFHIKYNDEDWEVHFGAENLEQAFERINRTLRHVEIINKMEEE